MTNPIKPAAVIPEPDTDTTVGNAVETTENTPTPTLPTTPADPADPANPASAGTSDPLPVIPVARVYGGNPRADGLPKQPRTDHNAEYVQPPKRGRGRPRKDDPRARPSKTDLRKQLQLPPRKKGKPLLAETLYKPPSKNTEKYRNNNVGSMIPGVKPVRVSATGVCEYTPEQIEDVRRSLPDIVEPETPSRAAEYANREKLVAQAELLMLKGVTNTRVLEDILKTDKVTTLALCHAVRTRWEIAGGPRNGNLVKGEALAKLAMIENSYWTLFGAANTPAPTKVMVLNNLINVIDRKMLIQGLTPRVLEAQAVEAPSNTAFDAQSPMEASMSIQKSLSAATDAAVQLIAQANGVYAQIEQDNPDAPD